LILTLSACAPSDGALSDTGDNQQPGSETGLANTRWRLVSYGEPGSETQVIEGTEVTLQFEEGNQAGGSGGCNTFGAEYEVLDGSLAFTQIISTEIACTAEGVMEQEQQYFQTLQNAGEFELTNGQLTIRYGDRQGVLNFVPMESS
jgi:heat shock protein HslJ